MGLVLQSYAPAAGGRALVPLDQSLDAGAATAAGLSRQALRGLRPPTHPGTGDWQEERPTCFPSLSHGSQEAARGG